MIHIIFQSLIGFVSLYHTLFCRRRGMKKMDPVVHFSMPEEDKDRLVTFK